MRRSLMRWQNSIEMSRKRWKHLLHPWDGNSFGTRNFGLFLKGAAHHAAENQQSLQHFLCFSISLPRLIILLTSPSAAYVFIVFGQSIATTIFGGIMNNLSDKYLLKKYPSVRMEVSVFAGPTGFRVTGDLDGPPGTVGIRHYHVILYFYVMAIILLFCGKGLSALG